MNVKKWFSFWFLCVTVSAVGVAHGAAQAPDSILKAEKEQSLSNALALSKEIKSNTRDTCTSKKLKKSAPQQLQLFDLPQEIVESILNYLNGESLGKTAQTCKWLRDTAHNIGLYNFLHAAYNDKIEVVRSVVEGAKRKGCKISFDSSADKFGGKTAIMCAAQGGNLKLMQYLVDCNAAIMQEDARKDIILWYASFGKRAQDVFAFFRKREDFMQKGEKHMHNLFLRAAEKGNISLMIFLLEHEKEYAIDVNKESVGGATALYLAAQNGHRAVVELLLKNKNLDVNKAEKQGATPLFIAAQNGHEDIVVLLVERQDTDLLKARPKGTTPLDIAYKKDRQAIVTILKEKLRASGQDLSDIAYIDFLL